MFDEDNSFSFHLAGPKKKEFCSIETSSSSIVGCNHQDQHSNCPDMNYNHDGVDLDQLTKARNMGIPELSPLDEVEGELIYFQHRLLGTADTRKRLSGILFLHLYIISLSFVLVDISIYCSSQLHNKKKKIILIST